MVADASRVHRITVLAGEGIGPEIIAQAIKVLEALRGHGLRFDLLDAPVGGPAIDACGEPLPTATLDLAKSCDVRHGGQPRF
jgi:3-isopropylmalate dehydrogenase